MERTAINLHLRGESPGYLNTYAFKNPLIPVAVRLEARGESVTAALVISHPTRLWGFVRAGGGFRRSQQNTRPLVLPVGAALMVLSAPPVQTLNSPLQGWVLPAP